MKTDNLPIVLVFFFILLWGKKIKKLSNFREAMIKSMVPALTIGLIYAAGFALGTFQAESIVKGILGGFAIFCLTSMGFAFAKGIPDYEPLPVTAGLAKLGGRARRILRFLLDSAVLAVLIIAVSGFFFKVFLALFHEPDFSAQATSLLPAKNKLLAFPLLLAGAGIAEESMFRLFFQSLFWRLFKRPWAAILLSSLCFALYHLTPADVMYQVYWHYPLTQVSTVFLTGIAFGWFYRKRGFETTVFGHTLIDYASVLLTPH
jgi:membrane protease YdiL (CAAX protease family)